MGWCSHCRRSRVRLTVGAASRRDYLRGLCFLKGDFVDLLRLFQLEENFVQVSRSETTPGEIDIHIKGPWLHTIMFEVPLLAIISEIYNRATYSEPSYAEGDRR